MTAAPKSVAPRTRRLHLILGPTGIGKTGVAVAAAARAQCTVIALDRMQCHPDIAVGSGRPTAADLAGTRRVYLDDRPVAAGAITPQHAIDRLIGLKNQHWDRGATDLILEGGSLSLLQELQARGDWRAGAAVHLTLCVESSAARYEAAVASRVERMLGYRSTEANRTLQDELADLWDDPIARKAASEIIGYSEAIALCEQHAIPAADLTRTTGRLWRHELASRITHAHLNYASQQRAALAKALPTLQSFTETINLCEI
jgi:tRNA A37 N6-isopentenylltransferase MiaA